jgi:predicted ester cyclase
MSARETADGFLGGLTRRDVTLATACVADDVTVAVPPLGVAGSGRALLAGALRELFTAFPDLLVTVKKTVVTGASVTAEVKLEGTQAAGFAGIVNQEKHIDVDAAWRLTVAGGVITGVDGFWCQQQVYRRLGVKRLDQLAIV